MWLNDSMQCWGRLNTAKQTYLPRGYIGVTTNPNGMIPSKILQETIDELARGGVDRKHPFRFFTFCTVDMKGLPDARMVVLRKFERDTLQCTIYTDKRSRKAGQLKQQPYAQLLFWHPKKRWQIKISASCTIQEGEEDKKLYQHLAEGGQASYNTQLPPSSIASSHEEAVQTAETFSDENFIAITCRIETLEILQLQRENHNRAQFEFDAEGNAISQNWLVP